jgi:NitT/TauT family transport system substrate-binding protein
MTTTRKSRTLSGLGLSAALAIGAAFGSSAPASAGEISIGHTIWVGYGPMYLARDLGYFKEEGVDVKFQVVEDSALAMAAEAGGKLSGTAVTIDEILKYRSKDFCFKAVFTLDDSHGGDGMVASNDINGIADIKGKTVAMNEGSTSEFWFAYLMKKNGMSVKDVTVSNMSADDAATAFIAGHVPVAVTWEPNLTMVKTKQAGKVLVDSAATPGVIVDVLDLSCDVIKNQPEDVKAFVRAMYRALDYLKAHQDEAYKIMAKGVGGYLEDPKDFAAAAAGVRFYDKAMNQAYLGTAEKPGAISDVIKLGNEIWGELGKMKDTVSYADIVDPTFVQQ